MSDLLQEMLNEFKNEMADDSGRTELEPFSDNIGDATKGYAKQFQSGDIQLSISLKITDSIPVNVGGYVTLRYPGAPRGVKWDDTIRGMVKLTDHAEIVMDRKNWASGLNRIISVFGLTPPTDEILSNEFLATGWLATVEGKKNLVFGTSKPDKNGYTSVPVFISKSGTQVVQISDGSLNARFSSGKNKGQDIPGLTRLEQAKQVIEKAKAKGV